MSTSHTRWMALVRGPLFLTAIRLGSAGASMATAMLAVRLISADEFGRYVSVVTVISLAAVALSFGLPQLIDRATAMRASVTVDQQLSINTLLVYVVLANLALVVILIAFAPGIYIYAAPCLFVTVFSGIYAAILSGAEFVTFSTAITSLVRPLLTLAVLWIVVSVNPGFSGADMGALALLISTLLTAILLARKVRTIDVETRLYTEVRLGLMSRRIGLHKELVLSAMTLMGTQLLIMLTTQLDILLLGWFQDSKSVAYYFAAARAGNVVSFAYGAVLATISPVLMRLASVNDIETLRLKSRDAAKLGSALTLSAALIGFLVAPYYLQLYGEDFNQAYWALVILLCSYGLVGLAGPAQPILMAYGKEKVVFAAAGSSLVVNALISITTIPHFGMVGAALGTSAQTLFYMGIQSWACAQYCGFRVDIFAKADNV